MLIKNIEQLNSIYGKIDAIMIVNKDGIVEYSAIIGADNELVTEDVMGKSLYDLYQNVNEENSTHARVIRTGEAIINEKQVIVEKSGHSFAINTSTFPIQDNGDIIGTIDISFNLSFDENVRSDKRDDKLYTLDDILTCNSKLKEIKDKCKKIAAQDAAVLVVGESGTGKELVVESIHSASSRKDKPFISLNCAAVPDSLMESTLFGTMKGSFTGAEDRKGLFELANGGTLFLDELNSMPMDMQAKLLKVVEEQKFMRIGGEKSISVDVRIISAMNVPPNETLEAGTLRKDLYYRLGVVQFDIPPLRERKEDIPLLVDYFIETNNKRMQTRISQVDDSAMKVLMDYEWPGNVRELRNIMESAFALVDNEADRITASDIPDYLISSKVIDGGNYGDISRGLTALTEEFEKDIIVEALRQSRNVTDAAAMLKLSRQALRYKLQKYQIDYKALIRK